MSGPAVDMLKPGATVSVTFKDGTTIYGEVLQRLPEKGLVRLVAWGGCTVTLHEDEVRSVKDASNVPSARICEVANAQREKLALVKPMGRKTQRERLADTRARGALRAR